MPSVATLFREPGDLLCRKVIKQSSPSTEIHKFLSKQPQLRPTYFFRKGTRNEFVIPETDEIDERNFLVEYYSLFYNLYSYVCRMNYFMPSPPIRHAPEPLSSQVVRVFKVKGSKVKITDNIFQKSELSTS